MFSSSSTTRTRRTVKKMLAAASQPRKLCIGPGARWLCHLRTAGPGPPTVAGTSNGTPYGFGAEHDPRRVELGGRRPGHGRPPDCLVSRVRRRARLDASQPAGKLVAIVANAGHDAGAADVHRKLVLRRWVAVHKLAADGAGGELAGEVVQGGVQAGHDASERTGVHVEALRAGVEEWLSGP